MTTKTRCIEPNAGDRLAAYEMGLMSPEEAARFERHLEGCSACQEDLYAMAPAIAELRDQPGRYAQALARQARQDDSAPLLERLAGWFRSRIESVGWRSLVPAVATAAILIAVFVQQRGGPNWEDLAQLDPVPYVQMPTRGSSDQGAIRFREAMTSYVAKDYSESARQLSALLRTRDAEQPTVLRDQTAFFAGLSFLLDRRPDSAGVYLTMAAESAQPVLSERSRWYLAQTFLVQGQPDRAQEILEALADASPGYGERAREQIESMERRQRD